MTNESQTLLIEARTMLSEAKSLNESGDHGNGMKKAYKASELVATAYLLDVTEKNMPQNKTTYDLFARTIRDTNRHPAMLQKIREIVGDVCALREVYEPILLGETTHKDAQQMIDKVTALLELVKDI